MSSKNTYGIANGRYSLIHRASMTARRNMYDKLASLVNFRPLESVLDVGVTSDQTCPESNFFEQLYPYKEHITALSDQDARWMERAYPGLRFVCGDGKNLPFEDASFDLVFSAAVIEHVGSFEQQVLFLKECYRVAKKFVFITTPNRWHPMEFHTVLPMVHMLPKKAHRKILNFLGGYVETYKSLAKEENLNLLDQKEILKLCLEVPVPPSRYHIGRVKFCGFTSNILLFIVKNDDKS